MGAVLIVGGIGGALIGLVSLEKHLAKRGHLLFAEMVATALKIVTVAGLTGAAYVFVAHNPLLQL